MQREVLELRRTILGERHPHTLAASHNLSLTLYRRDQREEVTNLLQSTMELRIEVLGEDYFHTRYAEELLRSAMLMEARSDSPEIPAPVFHSVFT